MREADVLNTVELVYAAAVDPAKWPVGLTAISDLLGGFDATLEVHSTEHPLPLYFLPGSRIPADGATDYLEYYCNVCPRLNRYERRQKTGAIGYDYDFMSETELDCDEFYSDFLAPADLRYYISATLESTEDSYTGLYVHRTPAQGHVTDEDIVLMRRLMPHLASAFDIHRRLERSEARCGALEDCLDMLDFAALLLDRSGSIVFSNRVALETACEANGFSTSGNRFAIQDSTANQIFQELQKAMFDGSFESRWAWGGDVHVPQQTGGYGHDVSLRRLPDAPRQFPDQSIPFAVVFIFDRLRRTRLARGALLGSFGLTAAELEVACTFAEQSSAAKVAQCRQVSVATVRTQLKNVMQKVGVRSQTELMQFMLSLRLPLK